MSLQMQPRGRDGLVPPGSGGGRGDLLDANLPRCGSMPDANDLHGWELTGIHRSKVYSRGSPDFSGVAVSFRKPARVDW